LFTAAVLLGAFIDYPFDKAPFQLVTLCLALTGKTAKLAPHQRDRSMHIFSPALVNFLKNEDGPTAMEYGVMLALIIVVCIAAISVLGSNASNTF
jgi:pilus assembly protein Flp/PilA